MVTLEPGRRARDRRGRRRPGRRGRAVGAGRRACRAGRQPRRPGPGGLRAPAAVHAGEAHPPRRRAWAAVRPTPRPSCAGPGATDPALAAALGADVPFCVVGGRARVGGIGERVEPLDFVARDYLLLLPPFGVDTAGRLPGLGRRSRDHDGPQRPGRRRRWRPSRGWPRGATRSGTWSAVSPALAGSGSTWFVEGGSGRGRHRGRAGADGSGVRRPVWCARAPSRRGGTGTDPAAGVTCRPGAASGWPSASSCASSCACACGAS